MTLVKKRIRVRELKPTMKIVETVNSTRSLESEVEQPAPAEGGIRPDGVRVAPTLVSRPVEARSTNESRVTPITPATRPSEERASYIPRSDAALYTQLSTENSTALYTSPRSRPDERGTIRPRVSQPLAVLGAQADQLRAGAGQIGGPRPLHDDRSALRPLSEGDLDRRYGLYSERDSLGDNTHARSRRR